MDYRPVFAEDAAEFLLQLPKRRQRHILTLIRQLASHPTIPSDYVQREESGRVIENLLIEDYVFSYWSIMECESSASLASRTPHKTTNLRHRIFAVFA